ncbi:MAG TPA: NAD(P)/FAD-dependent oxidoreductase [Solirubrobacteraceae bacterium]|nr:NAD(P)/FAD-dependent oxidoreductase [Solirubrobacteraceae bacterium]
MAWNVLILGGGFGGLTAARRLERRLPPHSAKVTLVNDVNFMLYTPLLPGAAGGTLEPRHVVVPLREELRHTDLHLGHVRGADPSRKVVHVRSFGGREEDLPYDQLIVALGSTSRTLPVPGLAEHAIGFKTLSEGIALRNRLLQTLEQAEAEDDPAVRRELLTYVFVGAGYAGVEGFAELQDFAADTIERYPRARLDGVRFVLVEARERIMTEIPPSLAAFASAELRRRGMEIRTGTTVERVTDRTIELSDGDVVPTRTVVWTAGVKPHPVVAQLGLPLDDGGRIAADRYCRVLGRRDEWAIGDAAAVPDPADRNRPSPPTAQHVLRQGKVVGDNVAAALGGDGRRLRPFRYRTLGVFVDMGRNRAVASTLGIKWSGFPAWFLARTYHLALMPGNARRTRLLLDWTVGLLFGRDSAELGQLGHPPSLADTELHAQSGGGTSADGTAPDRAAPPVIPAS